MKKRIPSFEDLVKKNKLELLKDEKEINRIEIKLETKHAKELVSNK